jgi:predicted alpha/beta superfamily hydrolase
MGKIIIEEMQVAELGNRKRKIRVVLPDRYDKDIARRYPVLYMHDGQNMMDPSPFSGYSWNVEPILKNLEKAGKIDGIIVVGIDTDDANRIPEYSQAIAKKAEKELKKMLHGNLPLPEAHMYGKFIVESLKPYIDKNYRTLPDREHTGTFGSSCGGNVTLYLGTVYNDVFGVLGAFSPAYRIVEDDLFKRIEAKTYLSETRIYHDMGGKEVSFCRFRYVRMAHKFNDLMISKGFDSEHLMMVIDKEGRHSELFWQERLPNFFLFAFPKQEKGQ